MKKDLPQAVKNLRKIWDVKKVEMQFTQVQAAHKLGWSQGAISHYLNNITELGPAAVIKFANFLEVDPLEIDPGITEFLPHVRTRILVYDAENMSAKVNLKIYDANPASAFWIKTSRSTFTYLNTQNQTLDNPVWLTKVCPVKDFPNAKAYLVQLKSSKAAKAYLAADVPPANTLVKKYAILETEISDSVFTKS